MTNVTSVGDNAFQNCSQITSITGGLHGSIGDSAFEGTGLTGSIDMSGVTSIGDYAFNNLSNISGTLDLSSCSQIGESAFQGCSGISGVTGLNGTIGDSAFRDTELSGSIDMANVTSVGSAAFAGCHISGSLNLSNCTTIGQDAFTSCVGVTDITIGSGATNISLLAFYSCGACDYTFLKDPNSITYGAGSAIASGATATWTDNGITRTYTWNSSTKHWDAPPIGNLTEPNQVGDIIFSDGTARHYADGLSALQCNEAVGVLFHIFGSDKYVVALEESATQLPWAPEGSSGHTKLFTVREEDGSGVWDEVICVEDSEGAANASAVYPAFNYANTYSATSYTSGWYLPAKNELLLLTDPSVLPTVKAALNAVGGTTISGYYWSSTQFYGGAGSAYAIDSDYASPAGYNKYSTKKARAIRKFN